MLLKHMHHYRHYESCHKLTVLTWRTDVVGQTGARTVRVVAGRSASSAVLTWMTETRIDYIRRRQTYTQSQRPYRSVQLPRQTALHPPVFRSPFFFLSCPRLPSQLLHSVTDQPSRWQPGWLSHCINQQQIRKKRFKKKGNKNRAWRTRLLRDSGTAEAVDRALFPFFLKLFCVFVAG